jgi:hypothetical protein
MTPALVTRLSERFYAKRVTLVFVSSLGVLGLLAFGYFAPSALRFAVPFAGPLLFLPWVAFCAFSWFHPERGSLRVKPGSSVAVAVCAGIRWYAAVFLALSVAFATAVWPVVAILWL